MAVDKMSLDEVSVDTMTCCRVLRLHKDVKNAIMPIGMQLNGATTFSTTTLIIMTPTLKLFYI